MTIAVNVPPVTPAAGTTYIITTGGTAVQIAPANINGGYVVNPVTSTDQGIGTAENAYVNPVSSTVPLAGNNVTTSLAPGQVFPLIGGTTLPTYANAVSSGHKLTVVIW